MKVSPSAQCASFPSLFYQASSAVMCSEYGVSDFNLSPSQATPEFSSLGNIFQLSPSSVLWPDLPSSHLLITMIQKPVVLVVIHTVLLCTGVGLTSCYALLLFLPELGLKDGINSKSRTQSPGNPWAELVKWFWIYGVFLWWKLG